MFIGRFKFFHVGRQAVFTLDGQGKSNLAFKFSHSLRLVR